MKLVFREVRPDEVEKEVTQRDQFNSDEVELVEALVREAHQNSLDAKDRNHTGPIRTRMNIRAAEEQHRKFFDVIFRDLEPHLTACSIETTNLALDAPRFLVIEDFGTTGLRGAWDKKDEEPFSDFWRRIGRSHKGGQQGGRWGLGKLVFSGVSRARAFFGVTVRADDPEHAPLLMGQSVLSTHRDEKGVNRDAHGFFCQPGPGGFQLPERDPVFIRNFCKASGISRISEPGLSIAIPFVNPDIGSEALIRELVRNYFFPILIGQLESEVDGVRIDSGSFDALATRYGGPQLRDGRVIGFIRELRSALDVSEPHVTLRSTGIRNLEEAFSDGELELLRDRYACNELVHVRVPVALRRRSAPGELHSHFDLFLRATDGDGHALVVRGAITLPLEAKDFRGRRALGALIARDAHITEFLGDAENPAHTKWNGNAEKLGARWMNPGVRLREIRGSLNALADILSQAIESVEPDALIDIFSIPSPTNEKHPEPKAPSDAPDIPIIQGTKRKMVIQARRGGFLVKPGPGLTPDDLPMNIRVTAAYDLIRGNPFKRHSVLDFDFTKPKAAGLEIKTTSAAHESPAPNGLRITAEALDFEISVSGFDPNRDLVVNVVGES